MIGTETTTTIDGLSLSVVTHRSGLDSTQPATVFLHGWGGSSTSFQPLWEALLERQSRFSEWRALDLPGFGNTPPPPTPWSIADYCTCVVKYLDEQGLQNIDIVCHSFGGRIATKLLALYPGRVRKIVYIAPAGIRHHDPKITAIQHVAAIMKPVLLLPGIRKIFPALRTIGYRLIGSTDYAHATGVMRETFKNVIAEDVTELLHTIQQPVYIFWGRNDTKVPVSDGAYMKQTIPNATLTIFEDGRHGIQYTHAKEIAEQMDTFLYS